MAVKACKPVEVHIVGSHKGSCHLKTLGKQSLFSLIVSYLVSMARLNWLLTGVQVGSTSCRAWVLHASELVVQSWFRQKGKGGISGMQLVFCILEFCVRMRELAVLSMRSCPLTEQLVRRLNTKVGYCGKHF